MAYSQNENVIGTIDRGVKIVEVVYTAISGGIASGQIVTVNTLGNVLSFVPSFTPNAGASGAAVFVSAATATSGTNKLVIASSASITSGSNLKVIALGI